LPHDSCCSCSYTGEWSEGAKNGEGKYICKSGVVYDGRWKDDARHGFGPYSPELYPQFYYQIRVHFILHLPSRCNSQPAGTCSYSNGDVYKGKWRANQKHGDGSYLFHNGNMYRGEWAHDRASGTGTCAYSNGDKYSGAWFQDRAHGKGVYTYSSGELYDGDWVHGKKTGRGVKNTFPPKF
jgi:hypothetical protein